MEILQYAEKAAEKHIEGDRGVILMDFPCPLYSIEHYWTSGLVAGRIIELFARAYKLSGE